MALPLHPPPYRLDGSSLERDSRVDVFTGGGPGGQHRNKTQNAVRLHHEPSGLVVTATERRSLLANREAAFERLRARLAALNFVPKHRKKTKPSRAAKKQRLEGKSHHAERKQSRRRPTGDE